MTFNDVLRDSLPIITHALLRRTAAMNRIAKTTERATDRARLYAQKDAAISRLLVLGAGSVEELLLTQGLITVSLVNGRRQHVPIAELSPDALQVVHKTLEQRLPGRD